MKTTEILIKIRKIVRSIDIESKKIQKEYGVSIPQVLCLSFLHESSNYQSTQGEIRKFLNLNPSTVSGIINRLEKKGYLARLPKSGDKRVTSMLLLQVREKVDSYRLENPIAGSVMVRLAASGTEGCSLCASSMVCSRSGMASRSS